MLAVQDSGFRGGETALVQVLGLRFDRWSLWFRCVSSPSFQVPLGQKAEALLEGPGRRLVRPSFTAVSSLPGLW